MPQHEHSHPQAPHEHEGDAPGHSHDETNSAASPPAATAPAAMDIGPSAGGLSARIVLTLIGAAGMIVGAFLDWASFPESEGTGAPFEVFYTPNVDREAGILTSAGGVVILLGLLALLGLALRTGWLSRLAGALGIVAFVLIVITIYRIPFAELGVQDVGIGLWLVLGGGIVTLIGGFLGSRRVVSANVPVAPSG